MRGRHGPLTRPPRHLAVVRTSALGDVLHTLPLICTLRHHWPHVRLSWIVSPAYVPLLSPHPDVDRLVPVDLAGPRRRPWRLAAALAPLRRLARNDRPDVALDAQGLFKSAWLTRATKAPLTLGLAREHRREPASGRLLDRLVSARPIDSDLWTPPERLSIDVDPPPAGVFPERRFRPGHQGPPLHSVEKHLALAGALGAGPPLVEYRLPVLPAAAAATARFVETRLDGTRPIGVNIGAAWETKRWPLGHWAELLAALADVGPPIVLLWGPGERLRAAEIARRSGVSPSHCLLAPPTDLPHLYALLAQCRLVISGDTGPLHLAVAADVPTLSLFGPTSGRRSGPFHRAGRQGWSAALEARLPCGPCYGRRCTHWVCLPALRPDRVAHLATRLLTTTAACHAAGPELGYGARRKGAE